MTYLAGLRGFGCDRDPSLTCDRCGYSIPVVATRRGPPAWLLDGRGPKGWRSRRTEDKETGARTRHDLCPACVAAGEEGK